MSLVNPYPLPSFRDWADFTYPALCQYGAIAKVTDDTDWQNWGAGLLSIGSIAQKAAPNPYQFSDWREWAARFNESLGQGY